MFAISLTHNAFLKVNIHGSIIYINGSSPFWTSWSIRLNGLSKKAYCFNTYSSILLSLACCRRSINMRFICL